MPRLSPGDHAPELTVTMIDGSTRRLADLWPNGPTALVFLRHFG